MDSYIHLDSKLNIVVISFLIIRVFFYSSNLVRLKDTYHFLSYIANTTSIISYFIDNHLFAITNINNTITFTQFPIWIRRETIFFFLIVSRTISVPFFRDNLCVTILVNEK